LAPEFFLLNWTEDLLKGELAHPWGSESDCEPGEVLPEPFSSSFSPKTVLADLARDALLGVRKLPAGLNLATLRDFWRAEPIFSTLFPRGVASIVEREEILGRPFFFLHIRLRVQLKARSKIVCFVILFEQQFSLHLHTDTESLVSSLAPAPCLLFLFLKVNLERAELY